MKLKKFTAMMLAAIMVVGCFTGCGKDEKEEVANTSGSVFDLLKQENDNCVISLDFNYKETFSDEDTNETNSKGSVVLSLDSSKNMYSLDTIKIEGDEDSNFSIEKLISGSKDTIYLNVGSLMTSLSSEQTDSSMNSIGMMLQMVFKDVEYLKVDLPSKEMLSTKEVKDEFIKNLETAIKNAGFNFVASEDGKTFTMKVTNVEGLVKIEKELYNQIKASSDVYATYMESSKNNLTDENVKTYIGDMANDLFEEVAKYFEIELTDSNKETLKTNIDKWLEEGVSVSTEQLTKEEAKKQIEESMDAELEALDYEYEDIKNMETTFVVKDTDEGMSITIEAKSETTEGEKAEGTFDIAIKEGKANISLPSESTDFKDIVGNIMTLLDGFGLFEDVKTVLTGADEETLNVFINSLFESSSDDVFEDDMEDIELIPYGA